MVLRMVLIPLLGLINSNAANHATMTVNTAIANNNGIAAVAGNAVNHSIGNNVNNAITDAAVNNIIIKYWRRRGYRC